MPDPKKFRFTLELDDDGEPSAKLDYESFIFLVPFEHCYHPATAKKIFEALRPFFPPKILKHYGIDSDA